MRTLILIVAIAAVGSSCGSTSTAATGAARAPATHVHARPVVRLAPSAQLHFAAGRRTATLTLHEPAGVILLYRLSAPVGTRILGMTRRPSSTAPMLIGTYRTGPSSSCRTRASRVTCTVGAEWCPLPSGMWRVRLRKLSGPAGDVTLWFRIGQPPAA